MGGLGLSNAWLVGGGAALAVLLVASIAVALLNADTEFEPGSPEAAVQTLLRAADDEDVESAYGLLSDALQDQCALEDFAGGPRRQIHNLADQRLAYENTRTVGETVFVNVRVTEFSGGDFFGSHSSFEQQYALRLTDGEWQFTQYPWPFFQCGPFKPLRPVPVAPARREPTIVVPTPESS